MKHFIPVILIALLAPTASHAGKYKWLDDTGLLHVSDSPPPARFADPITPMTPTPSINVGLTHSTISEEPQYAANEIILPVSEPVPSSAVAFDPTPDPTPSIPTKTAPVIQITPPERNLIASVVTAASENSPEASQTKTLPASAPKTVQESEIVNSSELEPIAQSGAETMMAIETPEASPITMPAVVDITPRPMPETEAALDVREERMPTALSAESLPVSKEVTETATPKSPEPRTTHAMVEIESKSGGATSLALPIGGALAGLAVLTAGAWFIRRRAMRNEADPMGVDESNDEVNDSTNTNPFFGDEPVSHENPTLSTLPTLGRA